MDATTRSIVSCGFILFVASFWLIFELSGWTAAYDFGAFVVFWEIVVGAVVAAMRCLKWGLGSAISAPLRVLLVPMGFGLAALVACFADRVCVMADISRDQAGFTLIGVGALLLASPLAVDLTKGFEKWKASVCMAAGTLLAGMGAVIVLLPGPLQPGAGLELFAHSAVVIARMLWVVACWAFVSLWLFAPGVEVALASVLGFAIGSRVLHLFRESSKTACACALAVASLCFGVCWWVSPPPPPVAACLGVLSVWLVMIVAVHYALRVKLRRAAPLWLFLACAASTWVLTELMADKCGKGVDWYPALKIVFPVAWACERVVLLMRSLLKSRRNLVTSPTSRRSSVTSRNSSSASDRSRRRFRYAPRA